MSMTLVARSSDLTKLVEEEYDLEIRDGNLLVHHVPYVNADGQVARCILVSELSTNGEHTITPGRHEVWIVGEVPHDHQGRKISIIADEDVLDYGNGLVASCRLSGKPHNRLPTDYHEKIENYVDILGRYARAITPSATHKGAPVRASTAEESVFLYHDAASSRSALSAVTGKLRMKKIAIVGLGGTGSYILDLVAKTPVEEVHLFDDDLLYAHNAFRAPGVATLDEVKMSPLKVEYFATKYGEFRRNIVAHPVQITEMNIDELQVMDFVFLSMDAGPSKRSVVEHLEEWEIPFVDCGMGVRRQENSLCGTVRVTIGAKNHYGHIPHRISYVDVNADEYALNIQTADLNMLNAAFAVIKWKKLFGYYVDRKKELNTTYVVASNQLISGETA
jgi:hypothetical protein